MPSITYKRLNNSVKNYFKEFRPLLKKVDIHVRPLFATALKGAYKSGFINGFEECDALIRGKKNDKRMDK